MDINNKKTTVIAISGVKNSGKTTLITKIIPKLSEMGFKVATIKHDGHDFEPDVEGTDTYKHRKSGAYGTAIFSKNKFMIVKEQKDTSQDELISLFPEADIILLEGFKYSSYPKYEIVRKGNSLKPCCNEENLISIISDFYEGKNVIDLNDIDSIVENIISYIKII